MPPLTIEPFIETLSLDTQKLKSIEQSGKKILGYFCTYTPIELVHAAGFLPVRIMGGRGTISAADLVSPAFVCPYIRRALEKGLFTEEDLGTILSPEEMTHPGIAGRGRDGVVE